MAFRKSANGGESKGEVSGRSKKKKQREGMELVAPDGGWGWVVVLACGMSNFSTLPLGQNFGLIYKEKYEEWGITQAEYSFMRNLEFTISSCTGLFSGALLRKYGFRKMALIGGCLSILAILITSQLNDISHFTIFFALLGGLGTGVLWPSNALALNSYFKLRRGVATGFSWTATGLSPAIMPQLISALMVYTDVHGTVLILAGIALHTIPAALLLQPVHWHGKWVRTEDLETKVVEPEESEEQSFLDAQHCEEHHSRCRRASLRRGQVLAEEEDGEYFVDTQSTLGLDVTAPISRHSSRWSLGSVGCTRPHHCHQCEDCRTIREEEVPVITVKKTEDVEQKVKEEVPFTKKPFLERAVSSVVDFFDLTIMKDPKFVSIFIGMTLAFTAEINFAVLVPFVYAEFGYEKSEVAHFMSILALVDLLTRFTVPFFTDKVKIQPKISYAVGLTILATGRIVLAHAEDFATILATTLWLGFGKGLRTVYMGLVIPSYVPLHRLPTASGLQMLANGVLFITVGPLFGYLRDNSDNYSASLHCINILTLTAVGLWTTELLVSSCRRRTSKKLPTINVENATSEKSVKDKK